MVINAPVPLALQPKYFPGSTLAPFRDNRNVNQAWKKSRQVSDNLGALSQTVRKMAREQSKYRRKPLGGSISIPQTQDFLIVSDGGDWYNCNPYNGYSATSQLVKVAKHQDIRCILPTANPAGGAWPSKVIRGVTYTYTYNAVAGATTDGVNVVEYTRGVVGSDSSAETDEITPCLNVGDIITAFQTSFAGPATLVGVTWQALADGRAWAAEPT